MTSFWHRRTHLTKRVHEALQRLNAPGEKTGLLAANLVETVSVEKDGLVYVRLRMGEPMVGMVKAALGAVDGVHKVVVSTTADAQAPSEPPAESPAPAEAPAAKVVVEGVRKIVAVASGKGGVGKSTLAVSLALIEAARGQRVGILDADVHGPSMPLMLGNSTKPHTHEKKLVPPEGKGGVAFMSMGLLAARETALIWRGPMVQSAIVQMLESTAWGTRDLLLIDMPPGTGDAQLAVGQKAPLDGVVMVSTPQEAALADVRRAMALYAKIKVPVLGIVENMAWLDAGNGAISYPFGRGGEKGAVAGLAHHAGVPFLGSLPLDPALGEACDAGDAYVLTHEDAPVSVALHKIAAQVFG